MTINVAAIGPDGTWIACDGLCCVEGRIVKLDERKWNLSPDGKWAFAGAGEVTYDGVLLYDDPARVSLWSYVEPEDDTPVNLMKGMRQTIEFCDLSPGLVRDEDCVFGDFRFSPLVATPGHVWRINSDLHTFDGPIEGVYQANGVGADYAVGAMSALLRHGVTSAETLVRAGVETACRASVWCGGEIFADHLEDES